MNMSDKEACSTVKTVDGDFLSYHLYLWEGLVVVAVNVILVYVIISNSKLRTQKEYLLYAGCIFFDIIFGLTYAIAAVYRFFLAWNNTYFPLFTTYQCILTPHIILFVYITPGAGILVLICSIDRFFGVFFPIKYIKMTTNYVIILFSISFAIPLLMLVAGIVTSSRANTIHNQQATCTTAQGTTADMYMILRLTRVVGSCACAIVYIPIFARIYLASISRGSIMHVRTITGPSPRVSIEELRKSISKKKSGFIQAEQKRFTFKLS
uniref:G protein-coupled receptor n=1 Tax=Pristionchus pacificus TaxID=54126 RepID=A0A2A6B2L5_PRIPA|eukprot:PDM60111.1 G protein-coupled receptor [Pristionchus pacificus]